VDQVAKSKSTPKSTGGTAQVWVRDLRVSFIWFEADDRFMRSTPPVGAGLPYLGHEATYVAAFNKILSERANPKTLSLPWPGPGQMTFWHYYMNNLSKVDGAKAWKRLVPLRRRLTSRIEADWFRMRGELRFFLEAFLYPHGQALLATAVLDPKDSAPLSVEEARALAFKIRFEKLRYSTDGQTWESQLLNKVSDQCLAELRTTALGPDSSPAKSRKPPFSVVTVVQGSSSDLDAKAQDDKELRKKLWALTKWNRYFERVELPSFDDVNLRPIQKDSPASHVLYGDERGRVIWFPVYFSDRTEEPPPHKLGHYHRNLVFCCLQVESLGALVSITAEKMKADRDSVSNDTRVMGRTAAHLLSQLHGGAKDIYQSWSARAQIRQNELVPAIDFWRNENGEAALL
jgi:hypothetical protein